MSDRFRIAFTDMRCLETTDDQGSAHDEPYALFFVADMQGTIPKPALFRTKVFEGVDEDAPENNPKQRVNFWGTSGQAKAITNPDKVIVLVALMERDDSDLGHIMSFCLSSLTTTLLAVALNGDTHARAVKKLKRAFRAGIDLGALAVGLFDSDDDQIGVVEELPIHQADLDQAKKTGKPVHKTLTFKYGDPDDQGRYKLHFELTAGV